MIRERCGCGCMAEDDEELSEEEIVAAKQELRELMSEFDADSVSDLIDTLKAEIAELEESMDLREEEKAELQERIAEIDEEMEALEEADED